LRLSELVQVHFVIAWAPAVENDASTWYAVDVRQEQILAGAGPEFAPR